MFVKISRRHFNLIFAISVCLNFYCFFIRKNNSCNNSEIKTQSRSESALEDEKIDWHDYKFLFHEASRVGPGEHGMPYVVTDPEKLKLNEELFKTEGFSVLLSNEISVNRSLRETRLDV
jgi:hypothetical protein